MTSTRRSLLKLGLAGLLMPQGHLGFAGEQNPSFDAWRRDFEADIPARMKTANVAGAAMAIASRQDPMLYAGAFGFADLKQQRKLTVDTPMHLASVSKLFTASALVQLFERKSLDLSGDINDFIDFEVRNPHHPQLPITARHLLTHTSSIFDEGHGDVSFPGDPKQSLSDFLRNYLVKGGSTYAPETSFLKAEPGAKWEYSNVAIALAGYVVERISGTSFSSYVKQDMLDPLGVANAHWYIREFGPDVLAKPYTFENGAFVELPQQGYPDVPAGMLRCSVSDLATSLHAMLGGGSNAILSQPASAEMLRRQVDAKIHPYQGLGWTEEETASHKVIGHTGSDNGASNIVALSEDNSQVAALLMNNDGTPESGAFRASVIDDLLAGAKLAS
ncbi:serine hydrolase domain-containing protein [Aminobacter carboxidus]|uniref:Beta-lactamase family protein n=1 Tax=Aminobacter carboxidus TaxID=376165 RepID=A0ABR9GM95_9HYPH|nr:serine hydrolase domain-containing protein [Aminobacter carboxidus]MBE1204771.1 beta-lactamase family protein [Aminobacter carboxidus]